MDSVASTSSSGIAALMQILSNSGSSLLSSRLSSSQVQSALQNAPPGDIVQLSSQALQLQVVNSLFGSPDASQTPGLFPTSSTPSSGESLANLFAALSAAATSTTPDAASAVASQAASYRSALQSEQMQTLFGTDATTGVSRNTLNVLA